ncbi:MAG TPA: C25 family cysteine peptidase [Thermoanaerobaculia bacterium]|nr:C25 family cysteine peptidase [Thermoanaerobaculia bacterium]
MPQGSMTGTASGDYVSDAGGLNTFYRYFIEVPAGVTRLQIEIFDADVGLGGGTEDTAGRDRDRNGGFTTTTNYSLLNPAAAARTTSFAVGSAATPAGSDNAWTTFFDSTGDDVRDSFTTVAYTNNDGLVTWGTNWTETNDDGNVNNGDIRLSTGELRLGDDGSTGAAAARIERQADLSAFIGATLTFDRRTQAVEDGDQYRVEVSSDGGFSWTTLETWTGALAPGTESYDISAFRASNTRIRFIHVAGYGNSDFLFVDNVRIQDTQITAGHWELRVDMAAGNDINAIGIRAHDGTSGAGGTELNVYFDSHSQLGINPPASGTTSRSYDLFPYVTSGCSAAENDFDYDNDRGNTGSMSFSSRSGSFAHNLTSTSLSGDDEWARNSFTGWASDPDSTGYGIWTADVSISSYLITGTSNGNYATFYMTNQLAAANPPAANPTTNAFRVYLPSDAGAAPVKPYVEQQLRHDSGPNPPAVGQISDFTVTVRVANPTPQAITFSASNLVTANVPGSGAVYGGAAQASQGSILSQPAMGGTGNVTWNPGVVAAGATALLSYKVRITPTSAGQRIPATATPASGNGTRATFVDETGNTTQARAAYTFGPLCELAVTQGLLTHAVVSSFRTFADERGGVRVEWTTASETGTAGFRLLRRDGSGEFRLVHEGLLPGLLHAAQGGAYRFHDEGASPRETQAYLLEEVEIGGRRRTFGPFASGPDWQRQDGPEARLAFEREAHPVLRKIAVPAVRKAFTASNGAGVHLSIRETGLYRLGAAQVAAWLGMTVDKAEKAIVKGNLSLTRGGQPAAWWPDMADKKTALGLFFYGESLPSLYSLDTVYRLQKDRNGPVMQAGTVAPATASAGGSFHETKPFETDAFPATAISPDPESDYWFWDFVISGDPGFGRRTFSFDAPALASGGGALTVRLQGATDNATPGEHHAAIRLNGTLLGETEWLGIAPREATFPVPDGVLVAKGNQLEILGTVGGGAPFSFFYVDSFEAAYPRQFVAEGDALTFTSGQPVTVSGFSSSAVRLLDVTDPLRPRWLTGAADGGGRFSFVPAAGVRYLAAGPDALKIPAAVRPWSDPLEVSVDVLIVVPPGLESEAERLAAHRRNQGLEAMVVNLEQVADLFGHGTATPHALRAFLAWASPRYAVLVGEGSLDYRNLQGYGDSVMPPLMVNAEGGLFPSDNRLAGPDMAIGRIPVLTAAELAAWIGKILAYESAGEPAWAANAIMLSDSPDGGAVFLDDSNRIAARLPSGISVNRIDLGSEALAQARARLFQGIAAGASLIDYVGHGGLDRLSAGGLLTSGDVPGLTNGERLPVLTAMTCTVNRFAVPGAPSLGELLVKSPAGGAAAVWGPSGLASHSESRQLAEAFYRRVDGPGRLGDWILGAMREFEERGGDAGLLDIYNLLGDPALIVRRIGERQ